eukprot:8766538-Pyramimonas_sp.AAC.2
MYCLLISRRCAQCCNHAELMPPYTQERFRSLWAVLACAPLCLSAAANKPPVSPGPEGHSWRGIEGVRGTITAGENVLRPVSVVTFRLAPIETSSATQVSLLLSVARCSAVYPDLFWASMQAPVFNNSPRQLAWS